MVLESFFPSESLTNSILPELWKGTRPEIKKIAKELNLKPESYLLKQTISEDIRYALINISQTSKHGEEIIVMSNNLFTERVLNEFYRYFGKIENKEIKNTFESNLADEFFNWIRGRDLDDPAGFSYETKGNLLYITMKKENQPLDKAKHYKGLFKKRDGFYEI